MKRTILVAALAGFILTACSENAREAAHNETEHPVETAATETEVVVDVPDYTTVESPVKEQVKAVLASYLQLKDNLVASDGQKTQESAKAIVAAAEKTDVTTLQGEQKTFAEEKLSEIRQAAKAMAESADLDLQRAQLEPLSEATFALTKAFGAADNTLYYQHCPMAFNNKGASWLSSNEEIRNPYFGDAMLKCGRNEEVYKK